VCFRSCSRREGVEIDVALRRATSSLCAFDAFSCAGSCHESEGPVGGCVAQGWECDQSVRPK
jgi:hypothetical protein